MVQTKAEGSQAVVTDYVLICSDKTNILNTSACGLFHTEEEANGAAIVNLLQYIEKNLIKWPKSLLLDVQESVSEICRQIKDIQTYKARYEYISSQCQVLFKDNLHIQFQILPIQSNSIPSQPVNESLFKIKVRNFLDVFQATTDIEEDLGNSEDDDDDEEEEVYESEEEEEEVDLEEEEEDLEEEEDIEEEEDEDEEPRTSDTIVHESESEDEGSSSSGLKRKSSVLEDDDDDEEDEIDEEADELEDDEESNKKRKVNA